MSELKWRRKWKPDLHSCSWHPLNISESSCKNGTFLVKAKFSGSSYEFLATDLAEFWYEKLDQDSLKKRSAKLNPNFEAPLAKIADQIKSSLYNQGHDADPSLERRNDSIVLSLTSQLAGLPFTWTFRAHSTDYDMGRDHLTMPLMAMVGELSRQKNELFKLLAAKDKQIDDYKAQGAKVTRKHFETTPFDEVAFNSSMVTSKGFEEGVKSFEDQIFNRSSQDLYRNICTKQAWLRHGADDLNNFDSDEEMESGDSRPSGGAPSIESWANRIPESIAQRSSNNNNGANAASVSPSKSSSSLSPVKMSPSTSPSKSSSTETTPVKDTELLRRQALERKLEQEESKKMEKSKKKKKLKL